ncbi:hypothetical protein L6R53_11175 [Myxococcota bacterium]|nr:hypothetical protein [Myxococcota bacterium]
MPARAFPHDPDPDDLLLLEDELVQALVGARTALAQGAPTATLHGDLATVGLGLAWLSWWRGRPASQVAIAAADAVALAQAGTEAGFVFRSPYDYWLLCCAGVALGHPAAPALCRLRAAQWSHTPRGRVEGMLPGVVQALAHALDGQGPPEALRAAQATLRSCLDSAADREEALRFAPTVGALAAVSAGAAEVWQAAWPARRDAWQREAERFPAAPMFLLDWEWLAMCRLALGAGLALPAEDVYRPHALLGAAVADPGTLGERLGPP